MWAKQKVIAQSVVDNESTAVPACFGVGKTWLAARLAIWFLYTHRPAKVITTAPTNRQVKDLLWAELRTAHQQSRFKLGGEPLTLQLHLDPDQYAIGFSTKDYNIDYFTGYHAPNQLVVFDQASGLPKIFWEAAEGLMTTAGARWLAIGNTAIPESEFANICMPGKKTKYGEWNVIPITALESPNVVAGRDIFDGIIAHDWVDKKLASWGEDDPLFQIFCLAKFVTSEQMVVIPLKAKRKMFAEKGEMHPTDIEIGVDVARRGTDSSVFLARSGTCGLAIKRVTGNDLMTVTGELVEFKRYLEKRYSTRKIKRKVSIIRIDEIGVGAGVLDRAIELELPAIGVNNAEAAVENDRYLNVRASMAWQLREDAEHGLVCLEGIEAEDSEIIESLEVDIQKIRYKISSSGKIQIIDKDELRKEIGRSPDYWDALVNAYEDPGSGGELGIIESDEAGQIRAKKVDNPDDEDLTKLFDSRLWPDEEDFQEWV